MPSAWATSAIGRPASTRPSTLRRNSGGYPRRPTPLSSQVEWWDEQGEYSWEWVLEPADGGTRLLQRLRVTRHPWTRKMLYELVAANGDVVMQRKLLRGIKQRAERLAAPLRTTGQETVRP